MRNNCEQILLHRKQKPRNLIVFCYDKPRYLTKCRAEICGHRYNKTFSFIRLSKHIHSASANNTIIPIQVIYQTNHQKSPHGNKIKIAIIFVFGADFIFARDFMIETRMLARVHKRSRDIMVFTIIYYNLHLYLASN